MADWPLASCRHGKVSRVPGGRGAEPFAWKVLSPMSFILETRVFPVSRRKEAKKIPPFICMVGALIFPDQVTWFNRFGVSIDFSADHTASATLGVDHSMVPVAKAQDNHVFRSNGTHFLPIDPS